MILKEVLGACILQAKNEISFSQLKAKGFSVARNKPW